MSDEKNFPPDTVSTAINTPDALKRWLEQSGRIFLAFNALDLVDALPFPGGVESFMQIVSVYRDHRGQLPVDEIDSIAAGQPEFKGETLSLSELVMLREWTERQIAAEQKRLEEKRSIGRQTA